MRRLKDTGIVGAILVVLAGLTGVALGQSKADRPETVLAEQQPRFAKCVTSARAMRIIMVLDLDGEAVVNKVEVSSEDGDLSKKSRKCIERAATGLKFAPSLAWKTIEHQLVVVNSGKSKG